MPRVRSAAKNNGFRAWPAKNWKSWVQKGVEVKKNNRWLKDQINSGAEIYSLGKQINRSRGKYYREEVTLLIKNGYRRRRAGTIYDPKFGQINLYKWILP